MSTMEQSASTILVTGATGNTGQALVTALNSRGATVRAMVRSQRDVARLPAGTSVAVADFDDPASVAAALDGAERAYLVTPSSERAEAQQRQFAQLAAAAGIKHLVVLSQLAHPAALAGRRPARGLRALPARRGVRRLGGGARHHRPARHRRRAVRSRLRRGVQRDQRLISR